MKELYKGHLFELDEIDGVGKQHLQFVQREPYHEPKPGVLNQEVLRVLIRRVMRLNQETPWIGNAEILRCLRRALLLHEIRAMERDLEKGKLYPECIDTDDRGHFVLPERYSYFRATPSCNREANRFVQQYGDG